MANKGSGVAKLLSVMKRLTEEVNDQEICRRLEILMNSEKDDLPVSMVRELLEAPERFDPSGVQDPYSQYIRHYLYMIKRAGAEKSRVAISAVLAKKKAGKKARKAAKAAPVRKKKAIQTQKARKKKGKRASRKTLAK